MIITALLFIFGLCFGSFLNVLTYRLPLSLPITGRSFCPQCKKKIAWYDNIPLLSFLLLRGRCRHCRSPISWQYPIVELLTAILTLVVFNFSTSGGQFLFNTLVVYSLIVVFFTDVAYEIIPDQIIYPAIIISLLYRFTDFPSLISNYLISGLLALGFLLILHLTTRGKGMGLGDVKLAGFIGLILGWPKIIVSFYLAFLTGAVLGVILILRGKKRLTSQIPFGPFLAGATILSLFYGGAIWEKIVMGLP